MKLKLMVLKHTPLGEINLPFVASSANAPRCRRNRRYHCFQRPKGSALAVGTNLVCRPLSVVCRLSSVVCCPLTPPYT